MHTRNFKEFIIHQKKKNFLSILSFALLKFICLSSSNCTIVYPVLFTMQNQPAQCFMILSCITAALSSHHFQGFMLYIAFKLKCQ